MNFDDRAKNWDTDKRIKRAKVIADEIINSINIDKNYSAMEFGCGTGLVSFNMHDKFKSITLVDSSKGMIDILNSKIDKYKVDNMIAYHLEKLDDEFLKNKFNVIYNSMVLHHIQDIDNIIKKFYKLLNENGYLCIVDMNEEDGSFHKKETEFHGHNGFDQESLENILISNGFKDVVGHTFYYGEKIVDDGKVDYSLFLMTARK